MTCCELSSVCCNECGKSVCSAHRYGTGSLSDGYACTLGCALRFAGIVPRPKQGLIHQTYGPVPIIAAVVIIVWSVIAALVGR